MAKSSVPKPRQFGNHVHPPVGSPEVVQELSRAALAVAGESDDPLAPIVEMAPMPSDVAQAISPIEDAHEVHALLLAGHTHYEVAHHFTIKKGRRYTEKEIEALGDTVARANIERTTAQRASIFQRELDRIEVMIKALWPQAQDGNVAAVDRVIKLQQRKADLLGLDQPDVRVSLQMNGSETDWSKLSTEELHLLKSLHAKAVTGSVREG